ncbi:MAG: hypothetical protein ACFBSC_13205 [Microcoleaceae cyanobacterium]
MKIKNALIDLINEISTRINDCDCDVSKMTEDEMWDYIIDYVLTDEEEEQLNIIIAMHQKSIEALRDSKKEKIRVFDACLHCGHMPGKSEFLIEGLCPDHYETHRGDYAVARYRHEEEWRENQIARFERIFRLPSHSNKK